MAARGRRRDLRAHVEGTVARTRDALGCRADARRVGGPGAGRCLAVVDRGGRAGAEPCPRAEGRAPLRGPACGRETCAHGRRSDALGTMVRGPREAPARRRAAPRARRPDAGRARRAGGRDLRDALARCRGRVGGVVRRRGRASRARARVRRDRTRDAATPRAPSGTAPRAQASGRAPRAAYARGPWRARRARVRRGLLGVEPSARDAARAVCECFAAVSWVVRAECRRSRCGPAPRPWTPD